MTNDITEAVVDPALEAFMEYFRRNYPGPDTIIGRPDWHSPKIFRAAVYAMKQSGALVPAADVQGLQDALRRVTAERDEWQTACSTVSASLAIKVADAEAEVARVTGVAEVDFPDDWRGSMNIKEQRIYSAGFNACRSLIHAVIWPHRALNGGKTDE